MKLAALYTIWNGLELLDGSIDQIKYHVDEIVICWQHLSNKGEVSNDIEAKVAELKLQGYTIVKFTPDLNRTTKQNEMIKHNLMIEVAKSLKCTHFFISACDHYYDPTQFQFAKTSCILNDYDVSFTSMYTYYKHPTWRMDPIENYYMPFICKLYPDTSVARIPNYPAKVDPALQITPHNRSIIFVDSIMMHHFSMIRTDIQNKFRNAAASIRWRPSQINQFISEYESAKVGDEISYFQGRKIIESSHPFDI